MRAALIVNQVTADREANLAHIGTAVSAAAASGAELIVLPEMAATGLINNGDPDHDLPLGQIIPGPLTRTFGKMVRRDGLYLAVGIMEREGNALYDSAVLLSPEGRIVLHYRRIQPHWHAPSADPAVYRQGEMVPLANTPLGRFVFLICGDLFDDGIAARARELQPDWVLFPFARCFADGSRSQRRWAQSELPQYATQVQKVGCTTLMVNYCSERDPDSYFGGAMVMSGSGQVLSHIPLGKPGTLLVDLAVPSSGEP
jgi:predicted amidohydrolase